MGSGRDRFVRDCSSRRGDGTGESGRVGEAGGIVAPTRRVFATLVVRAIDIDDRGNGNGRTRPGRVACSIDR